MIDTDLGITATRNGLTTAQRTVLKLQLALVVHDNTGCVTIRHGMCQGGDTDAHNVARELGITTENGHRIIGHPGTDKFGRAPYHVESDVDVRHEPAYYLTRDVHIVVECGYLIVLPKGFKQEGRGSGTWYTYRQAKNLKRPIMIIWPDGAIKWENDG